MKLRTAFLGVLLPFCIGLFGVFFFTGMKRFTAISRLTEMKSVVKGYATAQSAYYKKWGRFAKSDENAGFHIEYTGRFHFFTSIDAMDDSLKKQVPSHALPFTKKDAFQVLLVDEPPHHFWVADKTGDLIFSGSLKGEFLSRTESP